MITPLFLGDDELTRRRAAGLLLRFVTGRYPVEIRPHTMTVVSALAARHTTSAGPNTDPLYWQFLLPGKTVLSMTRLPRVAVCPPHPIPYDMAWLGFAERHRSA